MTDQSVQADIERMMATYGEPDEELEGWEISYFEAFCALEDGRRFRVRADQRDIRVATEALGSTGAQELVSGKILELYAIAWAYLHRTGAVELTWPQFRDCCIVVEPRTKPATVDPTGKGGAP